MTQLSITRPRPERLGSTTAQKLCPNRNILCEKKGSSGIGFAQAQIKLYPVKCDQTVPGPNSAQLNKCLLNKLP